MPTGTTVIKDALLLIQGTSGNREVEGTLETNCLRVLNALLRRWSTKGWLPWKINEVVLPLVTSQASYLLGSATTDAEWASETDFFSTTLSAAAASAATTLTVTSSASMTVGDRIGIELTAGTRHWTTVKTISSTTSIIISLALTGAAASANTVYTYTARPARPLRVTHARRRTDSTDTPIVIVAQEMYADRPTKTSSGTPIEVYYKPLTTSGRLYVWQPASSVDDQLRMTVEVGFTDIAASDDLDILPEMEQAVVYQLGSMLEPSIGQLDGRRAVMVAQQARELEMEVAAFASDPGSVTFGLTRRRRW